MPMPFKSYEFAKNNTSVKMANYGAHVLSWIDSKGNERLFLSEKAIYEQGKAIRGGVPIIFPQFNEFGEGRRHGFARNLSWAKREGDGLEFELCSGVQTKQLWCHDFKAVYGVGLFDDSLEMTIEIENTDSMEIEFTAALHTYLRVSDLDDVQLSGLDGLCYWDNDGAPFERRGTHMAGVLPELSGIDRVYFNANRPLRMEDGNGAIEISMQGFRDIVVWNPGEVSAKELSDFADHEYRHMICIEAAVVEQPIELAPGDRWVGSQRLVLR